jgi:ribosomal protein RSM22 (predicted rRNA methylase)
MCMNNNIPSAEEALREAIFSVVDNSRRQGLSEASQRLSQRYRSPHADDRLVKTDVEAEAYVAARLPATFTALTHVFKAAMSLEPRFSPSSQLDLGAGTGAAAWAATAMWPSLKKIALLEKDERMIRLGRRLFAADQRADNNTVRTWRKGDLTQTPFEPHDLITIAYVLGELNPKLAISAARSAWEATGGLLVIVEPGTTVGFTLIREIRNVLIEDGAALLAPCPHDHPCPITGQDWCHFAARVQRSALHRQLKSAKHPYEDEKFSYLVFSRTPAPRAPARVLRHPDYPPKQINFVACTGTGIRNVHLSKSHPAFMPARKLGWGAALPEEVLK